MLVTFIVLIIILCVIESTLSLTNNFFYKIADFIDRKSRKCNLEIDRSFLEINSKQNPSYSPDTEMIYMNRLETVGDYANYFHELTHKSQNVTLLYMYHNPIYMMKVNSKSQLILKKVLQLILLPIKLLIMIALELHAFYGAMSLCRKHGILTPGVFISGLLCLFTYINLLLMFGVEVYIITRVFS